MRVLLRASTGDRAHDGHERAHARLPQVESSPEQQRDVGREEDVGEQWALDAHVARDRAAEIAGEQQGAEHGGERQQVKDDAGELDDAEPEHAVHGIAEPRRCFDGGCELQDLDDRVEREQQRDEGADAVAGEQPSPCRDDRTFSECHGEAPGHGAWIWRTSVSPSHSGQCWRWSSMNCCAASMAASRDGSSNTAYPPMTSFASANGPSVVVTLPR